jgi:flagellar protein FliS
VSSIGKNPRLAAYQSVSAHSRVAGADPHALVLMLMDGAMERLAGARGCMERGETARKVQLINSCTTLLAELRGSLNLQDGGSLAQNLGELYDYMLRQLTCANAENRVEILAEVSSLLGEIRSAWHAIAPEVRARTRTATTG